jgi:hypothetical protein
VKMAANNLEGLAEALAAMFRVQSELLATQTEGVADNRRRTDLLGAFLERQLQGPTPDERQQNQNNQRLKLYMDLRKEVGTFERGKERWVDFAKLFRKAIQRFGAPDDMAKELLYKAIVGKSSRLVIAGMDPDEGPYVGMTFQVYMQEMAGKFMPASESIQMKAEYVNRKQAKTEDVQNYINEKYELYRQAYPEAGQDLSDFFAECTKGICNDFVQDKLFEFEGRDLTAYGTRAVFLVQVQRQKISIGKAKDTSLDGLVPVTKTGNTVMGPEPMEVDHLRRVEPDDDLGECECMAMHEQGFRGICYYCQKRGHLLRSCPRKSAGLPKIRSVGGVPNRQWKGTNKAGVPQKATGGPRKQFKTFPKKVNHLDEAEEGEEDEVEEDEEGAEETEEEVSFLGETL